MNTKEAAKAVGCSVSQIKTLIRQGRLKARKIATDTNQFGYRYDLDAEDVARVKAEKPARGWPRGKKRNKSK